MGMCAPSPTSKILNNTPKLVPNLSTCLEPRVCSGYRSSSSFKRATSPDGNSIRLNPLSGGLSLPGVTALLVEKIHSSE